MHQSSLDKMSTFRNEFLKGRENERLTILDLGSYDVNGSYKRFFDSPNWRYVGVDMTPGNNVDVVLSDPYKWSEIESSSIDVLVSGQAFEHIEFFWVTMEEIARVLKPGGLCCIIAPSGGFEHRYPVDCWRFYPDGFSALARFAKLDVIKAETQWEPKGYKDDSDKWKDTVLVCRKPIEAGNTPVKKIVAAKPEREAGRALFNPLDYSASIFLEPKRLTDVTSWHEHIPFAFFLIEMLKPKVFVELGTHKGDSYSAFCQAVNTFDTGTKCFAVDTWKGEEHAGHYTDEIYNELKTYHDPLYSRFSTMLRCTFDEALPKFESGSIDLLHIDGLHTYKAVRHDFETWLPKMSAKGVILFHDTTVREKDFGVWKLWEEIKDRYPSLEFRFGNGLGVLAVGVEVSGELKKILLSEGKERSEIAQLFRVLGSRISLASLKNQIAERDRQIEAILNSGSWKITEPIRKVLGLLK